MLKRDYVARPFYTNDTLIEHIPETPILARELQIIRRRWKLVLSCMAVAGAIGLAVAFAMPTRYSALVQFQVDYRAMQLRQENAVYSDSIVTDAVVESQVEILKSEPIALAVIGRLKLTDDPEFVPVERTLRDQIADIPGLAFLRGEVTPSADRTALHKFKKALSVRRNGQSHIVDVRFRSIDPVKAAEIANTISVVYLEWQTERRANIAKSASGWLRPYAQESGPSTRVLARAEPPSYASSISDKAIFGGFLVLGTCFGIGLALALEFVNGRIRNRDDLTKALPFKCFGVLLRIRMRWRRSNRAFFADAAKGGNTTMFHVVHHCMLASMAFLGGNTVRTIGVTSCGRGAGKSLLASNLAGLIARTGESKVLLVDANPYNPALSKAFAPQAMLGLAEVLTAGAELDECIINIEGVSVLPIAATSHGDPTSGMILVPKMEAFIQKALSSYDVIVFDLPSITPYADVRASAALLDVFLLVVGHGERAADVRESLLEIDDLTQKVSGTVLNDGVHL